MAEEPQDSKFDVSDLETTAAETPKAKRKRAELKAEPLPKPEGKGGHLPGVHERPKKGRKVSSEGKLNASVSGEIGGMSDVEQSLQELRDIEKARVREEEDVEWEAKIAETKKTIQEKEDLKTREREDAEWEAKIAESKKAADEQERAERIARMGARVDQAMEEEDRPKFTEGEQAWFKQGEDEKHVSALAAKQHEEEGRKIEDVRRQISESYDKKTRETILDTDQEVEAAAKQAEAMVASGRLNSEMFNAKDYRYLLVQQARIDNELETAGWWAARKLRSEMKEIRKELDGYESQIRLAMSERAPSGELTAREKEDIRYKGPMAKPALPKGSGTTVHKPGFFSRLFGKK